MGKTALLVMDMQFGIVERYAGVPGVLEPFQQAIAAARAAGIKVVFVTVAFREGFPEVSPNNKSFSAISRTGGFTGNSAATKVHPDLDPQYGDILVIKRRVSAFSGSDLEVILRAQQIDCLVLAGIATSGVVLSTVREAADRDYKLVVLADACLDADPEVHRVLTEKVFPRQAEVTTTAEWIARIGKGD